ncbi:hypothetical protein [Paraburkholderia youngii]|uniref:hypothetical protein n=1 Tax=Paraburkholderia youngii TaxID=2782701 RepID=UPI003D1D9C59
MTVDQLAALRDPEADADRIAKTDADALKLAIGLSIRETGPTVHASTSQKASTTKRSVRDRIHTQVPTEMVHLIAQPVGKLAQVPRSRKEGLGFGTLLSKLKPVARANKKAQLGPCRSPARGDVTLLNSQRVVAT